MQMTHRRELRSYDYVNHPVETVRTALLGDPLAVFKRATTAGAASAAALLHVRVGALELAADIDVRILGIEDGRSPDERQSTNISFEWKSTRNAGMFPTMHGVLSVYPLSPTETQLEINGTYDPPLGRVGEALDALALHRIAEASVVGFVRDLATFLRSSLPGETTMLVDSASQR